jgi:hypothetical protein
MQSIISKNVFNGISFSTRAGIIKNIGANDYPYVITDDNKDLFTCLSDVLVNLNKRKLDFFYVSPMYIIGRTFIQSEYGTRWTLGNTKTDMIELTKPVKYIEYSNNTDYIDDYRVALRSIIDIPCIKIYKL